MESYSLEPTMLVFIAVIKWTGVKSVFYRTILQSLVNKRHVL